jgi:hypothetical protein
VIKVKAYQIEFQQEWDDFIQNHSRNGTIFQEQKFLSYHENGKFDDCSLMIYWEDTLMGVLPGAIIDRKFISHPGSSAGGLVFRNKAGLREVIFMIDASLLYLQNKNIESVEFKLSESIFSWPTQDELSYALWHRGLTLLNREISTCIPLDDTFDWSQWGRKKNIFDIRKAEKDGFTVVNSKNISEAWHLINDNLDHRYQKRPTHTLQEITILSELYPERIDAWICYSPEGIAIATVVCFIANNNTVHDFYIAQNYEKVKVNLMPYVFHRILTNYKALGFKWFNFGISSRGNWIKWGILEFKERIGGRGINRDSWIFQNLESYNKYQEE